MNGDIANPSLPLDQRVKIIESTLRIVASSIGAEVRVTRVTTLTTSPSLFTIELRKGSATLSVEVNPYNIPEVHECHFDEYIRRVFLTFCGTIYDSHPKIV